MNALEVPVLKRLLDPLAVLDINDPQRVDLREIIRDDGDWPV